MTKEELEYLNKSVPNEAPSKDLEAHLLHIINTLSVENKNLRDAIEFLTREKLNRDRPRV